MSRAALWRQDGNVKERQRQAEELFQLAVEEGRNNRAKNLLPLCGPDDSFHFNPMLLQNIVKSQYFQKCCRDITDWNTLVDQIYYDVKHVEPWAQGSSKDPSAAFCLLLRLLTLRCTEKQMKLLLDHVDSPYIRATGFLYLRYAVDPKIVFKWIDPYLYDEEPIQAKAGSLKQSGSSETIGDYVRHLFTDKNYYGTILPRLPMHIERDIKVKLLQAEKIEKRRKKHAETPRVMSYFKKLGSKVMALYGDEDNPVQWYEGVVDRVLTTDTETGLSLRNPKFVVTFPEYGNTETVSLGEMEMIGVSTDDVQSDRGSCSDRQHDRENSREHRRDNRDYRRPTQERDDGRRADGGSSNHTDQGYSNGGRGYRDDHRRDISREERRWERGDRGERPKTYFPNDGDLYEEVRRGERETATSSGRNATSRRPPSANASPRVASNEGSRNSDFSGQSFPSQRGKRAPSPSPPATNIQTAEKRSAEEVAAIQQKKRKLMAKYG